MKLSKNAKARIKMMNAKEKAALGKAAKLLFENNCITEDKAKTIIRNITHGTAQWRS